MKKEKSFYTELKFSKDIFVMGILNVTPDSFSDGGKYFNYEVAVNHAIQMIEEGADIIDIGGESSRPGAESVPVTEELKRIIPVIENILKIFPDTIISVDTTKYQVAERALDIGAKIINDISGISDLKMLEVIKKYDASLVIMHMKGTPRTMQINPRYENVVSEVYNYLETKIKLAKKNGVNSLIVDPGIGFGKTVEHNYDLLKNLAKFQALDVPVLVGVSRKSLIGNLLNLEINERDVPSIILETDAVNKGAKIIRTHNVKNGNQLKKLNQLL